MSIAYCGLACVVCSESAEKIGERGCRGCRRAGCKEHEWCKNYKCCTEKNYVGCWECPEFPCKGSMLDKPRILAFSHFIKEYGEAELVRLLKSNEARGVAYHYPEQIVGDYDGFKTEEEIFRFIRQEKVNDYDLYKDFPTFETENFILRRVGLADAEDLLTCYSDEASVPLFNHDNCTSDFHFTEIAQIEGAIGYWTREYEQGFYIRPVIIDKKSGLAVGTIEMFNWQNGKKVPDTGMLRLDIASAYENEACIEELLTFVRTVLAPALGIKYLVTKAVPQAEERIKTLLKNGYGPEAYGVMEPFTDYYSKVI